MDILNYVETIDTVVDNAEIESLYMLLEYYNKELTMSVYMEDGEIKKPEVQQANPQQLQQPQKTQQQQTQPQQQTQQQSQQNPSVFEKIWNGIKRLFEIVRNAFKKFFDLFKKKPFKVNTVPDNEKQSLVEKFKNAATGVSGSSGNWMNHPFVQKAIRKFNKLNPGVPIKGMEIKDGNLYFYTQNDDNGRWKRDTATREGGLPQDLIQLYQQQEGSNVSEAALVKSAASPIMSGIQTASRIGNLTGNNIKGAAVGAGVGGLETLGKGLETAASVLGFPIGMLAGFTIGNAFSICATILEKSVIKSIKTLPQPKIVKKAGDDLYVQSESFYSIMNNMKLDADANLIIKSVYDYIKHDKFDHTGENCISIMDNWLKRVSNDPFLSRRNQNNNQANLTPEQLQLVTDATIYIEMLNKQNGDQEIIQLLDNLNKSFDKTNQYIQSPNCIVVRIQNDRAKQLVTNVLNKNAKNCLIFINCMNEIKNLGTNMWNNINAAAQKANNGGG